MRNQCTINALLYAKGSQLTLHSGCLCYQCPASFFSIFCSNFHSCKMEMRQQSGHPGYRLHNSNRAANIRWPFRKNLKICIERVVEVECHEASTLLSNVKTISWMKQGTFICKPRPRQNLPEMLVGHRLWKRILYNYRYR
mgnify:CR=1 FL=1